MSQGNAIRAGRAFVEFFVEDGRLERGLKTVERKMQFFGRRLANVSRNALQIGIGAAVALAFPLSGFKNFDDQIKELESLAVQGATSLQELREQAKQLGRDTSFTAIDVAGGMTEEARAGFNTDQIAVSIADVMNLARATRTELPRAVEIAAGTLRAFNLQASEMRRVVNVAVAATNKSAIGMEDYAESMKYAAPVANMLGMSLEETSKAVAVLGNFQIKGSLAGTALRNSMMRIADPKIRSAIEQFTPVVDEASGRIKDISQIMQELGTATAGDSASRKLDRLALMTELFGLRSTAAAIVISENVAEGFDEAFSDPDFAEKVAKHMDSGIGGALRRLGSMWEGVTIAFGEATQDMLIYAADGLTKFLSVVRAIIDKNPIIAKGIVLLVAGLVAVGVVGVVAGFAIRSVSAAAQLMALSVRACVVAWQLLTMAMSAASAVFAFMSTPVGVMILALRLLVGWFVYSSGAIQIMSQFLKDNFATAWATVVSLIASGDLAAAFDYAMSLVKATWAQGVAALKNEWDSWVSGLSGLILEATAGIEIIWLKMWRGMMDGLDQAIAYIRTKWRDTVDALGMSIALVYAKVTGLDPEEVAKTYVEDMYRKPRRDYNAEAADRVAQSRQRLQANIDAVGQRVLDQKAENDRIAAEKKAKNDAEAEAARARFKAAQGKADGIIQQENAKPKPEGDQKSLSDKIRDMLSQGPLQPGKEKKANEAIALRSKEGQESLARAIFGNQAKDDKLKGAIDDLQGAVVNQLEELNEGQDEFLTNLGSW